MKQHLGAIQVSQRSKGIVIFGSRFQKAGTKGKGGLLAQNSNSLLDLKSVLAQGNQLTD